MIFLHHRLSKSGRQIAVTNTLFGFESGSLDHRHRNKSRQYLFAFIIDYLKVAVKFPLPLQYWGLKVADLISIT